MTDLRTNKTKTKYGHTWRWIKPSEVMRGHWKSTSGNLVQIFPATPDDPAWHTIVCGEEIDSIIGDNLESRSFAGGAAYVRQRRPSTPIASAKKSTRSKH